jgi:hypothetical protein
MKSKSHTLAIGTAAESVLVETQVQNATQSALYLTSVQFAPTPSLAVDDLNSFELRADQLACLKPGDVQQYMYRLRAAPGAPADALRAASALGRMDVHWMGPMMEAGHLQSNVVQRRQPPMRAVEVRLLGVDSSVPVPPLLHAPAGAGLGEGAGEPLVALCEVPFLVRLRVLNCQDCPAELKLLWLPRARAPPGAAPAAAEPPPLVFTGVSGAELAALPAGGSTELALELVALLPGLHRLAGLVLQDRRTGALHDAGVIGELLVLDSAGEECF